MRYIFTLLPLVFHSVAAAAAALEARQVIAFFPSLSYAAIDHIYISQTSGEYYPLMPNTIYIRQQSTDGTKFQAMVTSYSLSGGSDAWYDLPDNFDEPALSQWSRKGWELAAITAIGGDGDRHGLSVLTDVNTTTYITVRTLNSIDILRIYGPP